MVIVIINPYVDYAEWLITCREQVKAWGSFDKSYQVPNILLVCYSEETVVYWTL